MKKYVVVCLISMATGTGLICVGQMLKKPDPCRPFLDRAKTALEAEKRTWTVQGSSAETRHAVEFIADYLTCREENDR